MSKYINDSCNIATFWTKFKLVWCKVKSNLMWRIFWIRFPIGLIKGLNNLNQIKYKLKHVQ